MNLNRPTDAAIRHALRGLATEISSEKPAPPAPLIYLRAEYRARQLAIARATLPLCIMQTVGMVVAIAASAWAIHQSLSNQEQTVIPLLKWAALALLLVLAGCWTLIQAGRIEPDLEARS
jgi:hypothetical protein